ncbi:MAG: hypothetical protein ACOC8H_00260 [bacterium]
MTRTAHAVCLGTIIWALTGCRSAPPAVTLHSKTVWSWKWPACVTAKPSVDDYQELSFLELRPGRIWIAEPKDADENPLRLVDEDTGQCAFLERAWNVQSSMVVESRPRRLLVLAGTAYRGEPYVALIEMANTGPRLIEMICGEEWRSSRTLAVRCLGRTLTVFGMDGARYDIAKDTRDKLSQMGLAIHIRAR